MFKCEESIIHANSTVTPFLFVVHFLKGDTLTTSSNIWIEDQKEPETKWSFLSREENWVKVGAP